MGSGDQDRTRSRGRACGPTQFERYAGHAMRVGFDASPLVRGFPPGVTRAARGLLDALERRGVLEVVRLLPPEGASSREWRRRGLPAAVARERLDGLHSFTSAFAHRARCKRVQTIHELPWRHGVSENADLAHRIWAALGPCRADRVVVPTAFVADDLRRRLLPGKERIRVTPWGVGPPFALDPEPGAIDEVVLERHRLGEEPFLLALGAVRPKKGLDRVLHGMAALAARGEPVPPLVVTGPETPQLRRDLGLASQLGLARYVSTLDDVDEADLPALVRLSLAVPVLSRSEGFGLPVLEALACGVPVLVPRDTAQAEVAGTAGTTVDADAPEEVADAILRARAERLSGTAERIERARAFSWDASATAVEAVWAELA